MKSKVIIANWKMALTLKETENLTLETLKGLENFNFSHTDVVLCPSFPALPLVNEIIKKSKLPVLLGSQDVFWEEKGAYTGAVSPLMLKEIGVKYIIIGHSERRLNLKETDEMVHKKMRVALINDFIPILCVGETFEERENNQRDIVIIKQVSYGVEGINLSKNDRFIIAYEPVWAIGSGQAVEPMDLEQANFIIKQRLVDLFGLDLVERNVRIIYGGSVDSHNIDKFVKRNIDGFLIGGASLNAQEFLKIVEMISKTF